MTPSQITIPAGVLKACLIFAATKRRGTPYHIRVASDGNTRTYQATDGWSAITIEMSAPGLSPEPEFDRLLTVADAQAGAKVGGRLPVPVGEHPYPYPDVDKLCDAFGAEMAPGVRMGLNPGLFARIDAVAKALGIATTREQIGRENGKKVKYQLPEPWQFAFRGTLGVVEITPLPKQYGESGITRLAILIMPARLD